MQLKVGFVSMPAQSLHSCSFVVSETTFLPFSSQINQLWSDAKLPAFDLQGPSLRQAGRRNVIAVCVVIFLLAAGVRLLHWQDNRPILPRLFSGMVATYKGGTRYLMNGDVAGFIKGPSPPGEADILTYPPGYPIVMAAVFKIFGGSDSAMRAFQITCDALTAVLLFFLALEFVPWKIAPIAGALAALSPQFAYYSLILIPDSLVTLPLLLALYFLVRAVKQNRLRSIVFAGLFIGISCWLRSNALLLAPFLALLLLLIVDRARRWRYAGVLVATTLIVIAPITIRNMLVFHHFIPLSLGAGQMLTVGISDYDKERHFGLPGTDLETVTHEAEAYGRPEFANSLFGGDGPMRDRDRTSRAIGVIKSHPFWFAGVVLRRAVSMLKFERVQIVNIEPGVTHSLNIPADAKPDLFFAPVELLTMVSTGSDGVSAMPEGNALKIETGRSNSPAQTIFGPMGLEPHTDYLLRLPLKVNEGNVVISISSSDGKTVYASTPVFHVLEPLPGQDQQTHVVHIPFTTGEGTGVQLSLNNEGRKPLPTVVEVGKVEVFRLGPASLSCVRYVRAVIHVAQKFFVTAWMIPLALLGAILLRASGAGRFLVLLLAVPLYYLSAQSFLHTEYRYVMAIQPPLFILVAAALYSIGALGLRLGASLLHPKEH